MNKEIENIVAELKADGWEINNLYDNGSHDDLVTINRLRVLSDKEEFETAFFRKNHNVVYINVYDDKAYKLVLKLILLVKGIN